jgi:hypothetical protein
MKQAQAARSAQEIFAKTKQEMNQLTTETQRHREFYFKKENPKQVGVFGIHYSVFLCLYGE